MGPTRVTGSERAWELHVVEDQNLSGKIKIGLWLIVSCCSLEVRRDNKKRLEFYKVTVVQELSCNSSSSGRRSEFIFSGSFEVSNLERTIIIIIFMSTNRLAAVNHANNLDLANFSSLTEASLSWACKFFLGLQLASCGDDCVRRGLDPSSDILNMKMPGCCSGRGQARLWTRG